MSVDGDADRVIYYYVDETNKFHLLDGDRIATLVAGYFKELVEASGLTVQVGLVQTAYANGASTDYILQILVFKNIPEIIKLNTKQVSILLILLNIPEMYDIIYFEYLKIG